MDEIRRFSSFFLRREGSIARLLLWLHNLDARQGKSLKSGDLIENARVWKGVSRFIRNTFIVNPSFVGVAQKVNRAKLIDDENVLKRMSFLLTAVIHLPVDFDALTANGTFNAVIEKPPGQKGFAVIPKRWVVERSIAWAGRNRLASKEYNRNPESSEAFLYLGSIAMLLNRLYPRC